ncbi:hypothetical protein BVC80_8873g6 [Macleaya cordata]|uniref:EF-hand domain n=1 Tax=Macleaya cordata TaxID=56857 RepID=A0A200Q353_MACCD|nr:hypothetical protein BVC80_8873g6 [Macleaya cordata]
MGRDDSSTVMIMKQKKSCGGGGSNEEVAVLMEGSDMLMELTGINEQVFNNFVEHKFQQLDTDHDGKLSVKELEPSDVVADIGAALIGTVDHLPAAAHHQVLNEFTSTTNHGNNKEDNEVVIMNKTEFKEAVSDILLLGMAAAGYYLNRDDDDPIVVILRMDGEDLLDFINSPRFETEMMSIFTRIQKDMRMSSDDTSGGCGSLLRDYLRIALQQLTVDHGIPPSSDSWVMNNIIEPALGFCSSKLDDEQEIRPIIFSDHHHQLVLEEFKKVAERLVEHLKEKPVIVAHSQRTFDGSGINKLLSNKFDLDKALDMAMKELPKDCNLKLSEEYLLAVLDVLSAIVGLPRYGAINQMDKVVDGVVLKTIMKKADEGNKVIQYDGDEEEEEEKLKILMTEILRNIMLELEAKPISVFSNSVIHGPLMITSSTNNIT